MMTDAAALRRKRRHAWEILLTGFALIGLVFVAQGLFTRYLTFSTEMRSRRLERDSLHSVDDVNRIARAALQIELLVNEHIDETDPTIMAGIETNIDALLFDIDQASRAYEPLIDLPDEAAEWDKARASLVRFRANVSRALDLSRLNLNVQARGEWKASRAAYSDLGPTLTGLIALNRTEAMNATAEVGAAEQWTREVNDAIRFAGLMGVVLLAQWVIRRVLAYERQLQTAAELLARQNQDLDAFAGRVAHDLKNALGPMLIFPALMRRDATDPQRVRALAQSTERSARRTTRVIDSMLTFARAAHDVDPNATAGVREAVESVLEETAQLASNLGATIEVAVIPDVVVRCEPGLLHAVLGNLLGNAIKYLAGRPVRHVQVRVDQEDGACRFEIVDTGPGIPKNHLQSIFEPFYRVDPTLGAGTGLGLATVRRILDARSGRITIESEEGRGTQVLVWLPLATLERFQSDRPGVEVTWANPTNDTGARHVH
jgi:signal transduction histidine kinase